MSVILEREYVLTFRARWFSFLPWPKRLVSMSKITTFPDVNELADKLVGAGCTDVTISWDKQADPCSESCSAEDSLMAGGGAE